MPHRRQVLPLSLPPPFQHALSHSGRSVLSVLAERCAGLCSLGLGYTYLTTGILGQLRAFGKLSSLSLHWSVPESDQAFVEAISGLSSLQHLNLLGMRTGTPDALLRVLELMAEMPPLPGTSRRSLVLRFTKLVPRLSDEYIDEISAVLDLVVKNASAPQQQQQQQQQGSSGSDSDEIEES